VAKTGSNNCSKCLKYVVGHGNVQRSLKPPIRGSRPTVYSPNPHSYSDQACRPIFTHVLGLQNDEKGPRPPIQTLAESLVGHSSLAL